MITLPSQENQAAEPLLRVDNLTVGFQADDGTGALGRAVADVSFSLVRGQTLCLVGESGCGKSVTAMAITGLLPSPPAHVECGSIFFDGRDLAQLGQKDLNRIRGNRIGMVFQDPMTSLNPVLRVGEQIAEPLRLHKKMTKAQAGECTIALLDKVGIAQPAERATLFPHQMSGGMRQRVMIAMAMACEPDVLIADEPTTALDVTIQRQILALMQRLVHDSHSALLLITHDFTVVEQIADSVAVMYAGSIVEQGAAAAVLNHPLHPYTKGLLASRPGQARAGQGTAQETPPQTHGAASQRRRLEAIPGTVPGLWHRPSGCTFHPRCPYAEARCRENTPSLLPVGTGTDEPERLCRCWLVK